MTDLKAVVDDLLQTLQGVNTKLDEEELLLKRRMDLLETRLNELLMCTADLIERTAVLEDRVDSLYERNLSS